ncbi:MAG: valine--tRNA ligase [Candidatus Caldatribacteriota bacterium]|nr:valine--tRNA ligase [Candidatus Caldatribacteriota bacterium]
MKTKDMEMSTVYNPKEVEENWYKYWLEKGYFQPKNNSDKKNHYSIVIPPPNVTGSLHIGHALNNTLQDILIRWKRMEGYNTLWLPGTDHAGIATQNVVERELAKNGKSKEDLGREKFVEKVWQWKTKYGDNIIEQLKKLGFSCDWSRLRFTFDEGLSKAVRKVFVRLYKEGLIYRENYVVNWCPRCQTAIADIEVESREENANLYYVEYHIKDSKDIITVATTRPETMLGDTAVAVNPNDKRYKKYIGKIAILPVVGRELPIVADDYVDVEFGTGAVKITPAHDINDFELGKRHKLEEINILNDNGTMNEKAGKYKNLKVLECRKKLLNELKEKKHLVKIEDYTHSVGHCYRCDTVIEPLLSRQWFVKIKKLAEPAIKIVEDEKIKFTPSRWTKVYYEWMRNIKDWCISRQLWWGHRIPVWYCQDCSEIIVEEEDPKVCTKCGSKNIIQDPDVLDTWFSSALWPFSTLGWPKKTDDLNCFYPTSALVTGFDIIFFWVARMIMMGLKFGGNIPFKDIVINPLVKDAEGKKMSKSKGNAIDPLTVVDKYGADTLRVTLASLTIQGDYICLSEERIKSFRNFTNKIWNASRFSINNLKDFDINKIEIEKLEMSLADKWIFSRLNRIIESSTEYLNENKFGDASKILYEFVWNEFCDWYIEFIKPRLYQDEDIKDKQTAQYVLWTTLESILRLLHPFMPFITEEIWQKLSSPHKVESIMIAPWPEYKGKYVDNKIEENMIELMNIIKAIRNIKADMNISYGKEIDLYINIADNNKLKLVEKNIYYFKTMIRTKSIIIGKDIEKPENSATGVLEDIEIFIPLKGVINIKEEIERLEKRLKKTKRELNVAYKKINNKDFLSKAPTDIINKEKTKVDELIGIKEKLENNLKNLR